MSASLHFELYNNLKLINKLWQEFILIYKKYNASISSIIYIIVIFQFY